MHKKLTLVAALTVVLGSRVMAHEGAHHDEPKTEQQGENPAHKEHKAHGHKDHKGAEHGDKAKGAKAKKTAKKKGKAVKAEETKPEMPAGMSME